MEIRLILSAMSRNKVGALLVAVQMAVTLAILCNALFVIQERLALSRRPTGTDEANLFAITNQWVGQPADVADLMQADVEALRALPGVVDAYCTNSYPLTNDGAGDRVSLEPGQTNQSAHAARYFADEHAINTLGLKLIAGRNFSASDFKDLYTHNWVTPSAMIVTKALADHLFPNGDAVGHSVYTSADEKHAVPIIGVVEKLQSPWASGVPWAKNWVDNSALEPFHYLVQNSYYVVRAQPGRLERVMRDSTRMLYAVHHARVIDRVQSFDEARRTVYCDDRGLAVILAIVCAVLLLVTAFGTVGLTSYWVAQRRRQIGIRRALGATRATVVRYFQTENLLIGLCGGAAGIVLAIAVNLWMVDTFEAPQLHVGYIIVGAVLVVLLGQLAVLWPALRAASIPPATATRTV